MLDRRCNDNRIEADSVEHMIKIRHALDVRIQATHVLQTCFADVAHRPEMTVGQPFEVANQIGSPISAANNAHKDWFFHNNTIGRSEVFSLLALTTLIIFTNVVSAVSVNRQAAAFGRFPVLPGKIGLLRYIVCYSYGSKLLEIQKN